MGRHQAADVIDPVAGVDVAARTRTARRLWLLLGVVLVAFAGGTVWVLHGSPRPTRSIQGGPAAAPATSAGTTTAGLPADVPTTGGPAVPAAQVPGTSVPGASVPGVSGPGGSGPGMSGPGGSDRSAPPVTGGPAAPGGPPVPSLTPTAAPLPSPVPTMTPVPTGAVQVRTTSAQTYQGGYTANYAVDNGTGTEVDQWMVALTFSVPVTGHTWNAQPQNVQNATTVTLSAASYNATIAPGQARSFGLQVTGDGGATPALVGCTVNGAPCG